MDKLQTNKNESYGGVNSMAETGMEAKFLRLYFLMKFSLLNKYKLFTYSRIKADSKIENRNKSTYI